MSAEALNAKIFPRRRSLVERLITKYSLEIQVNYINIQNPMYISTESLTWSKSWCSFTTSKRVVCVSSLSPRNAASERSKAAWSSQLFQFLLSWSCWPSGFHGALSLRLSLNARAESVSGRTSSQEDGHRQHVLMERRQHLLDLPVTTKYFCISYIKNSPKQLLSDGFGNFQERQKLGYIESDNQTSCTHSIAQLQVQKTRVSAGPTLSQLYISCLFLNSNLTPLLWPLTWTQTER